MQPALNLMRRHGVRLALAAAVVTSAMALGLGAAVAQSKTVELGFVYWETRTDAFVEMANGGKAVADLNPSVHVKTAAPDAGDPQKQVALFGPIAQTQKDGIVLQSLASGPLTRPVTDAINAGVPVVAIDAPPPAGTKVGLFITADNVSLGAQLAEKVLSLIPKDAKGSIVIGNTGVGVPPLEAREKGMIAKIKELRPDLKIVGPASTFGVSGASTEIYAAWQGLLNANPDAVAVLAPSAADATAWGLLAQRTGFKLPSGGFDLEAGNLDAVKKGYVSFIMSPEHWLSGYIATKALAESALNGTPLLQGLMLVPGKLVDSSNIDEIIARQSSTKNVETALSPVGDDILAHADKYIVGPWPPAK